MPEIPLAAITPSPTNPRKSFDEAALRELADSIKTYGLLQAVLVRPKPKGPDPSQPIATVCSGEAAGHLKAFGIRTFGDLVATAGAKYPDKLESDPASAVYAAARGVPGVQPFEAEQLSELFGKRDAAPDAYELVAGERRFRAAKLAGLAAIPADVRHLTNVEVLEIQCVENDQREDTLPSERAAGYQRLVDAGVAAEALAAKVGKSVSWVRDTLRLGRLPPRALDAVDDGRLGATVAALVARLPGAVARSRVTDCVLAGRDVESITREELFGDKPIERSNFDPRPDDAVLTYQETKELIAEHCQVELKGAPFDRKCLTILPNVPACDACPKRAGNDPELKAAGVRADVCTDPECYRAKCDGWRKLIEDGAKADGLKVLPAGRCKKLFDPYGDGRLGRNAPYFDLAAPCPEDPKKRTYKQLLEGRLAEPLVVAVDPDGKRRVLAPKEAAIEVLKAEHKIKVAAPAATGSSRSDENWKARMERESRERRRKAELGGRAALLAIGRVSPPASRAFEDGDALDGLLRGLISVALYEMGGYGDDARKLILRSRGLSDKAHTKAFAALLASPAGGTVEDDTKALFVLLAEVFAARLAASWSRPWQSPGGKDEKAFWSLFGVDKARLFKEAEAQEKKAAAPEPSADGAHHANGVHRPKKRQAVPA